MPASSPAVVRTQQRRRRRISASASITATSSSVPSGVAAIAAAAPVHLPYAHTESLREEARLRALVNRLRCGETALVPEIEQRAAALSLAAHHANRRLSPRTARAINEALALCRSERLRERHAGMLHRAGNAVGAFAAPFIVSVLIGQVRELRAGPGQGVLVAAGLIAGLLLSGWVWIRTAEKGSDY